jgi:hypothetical protein
MKIGLPFSFVAVVLVLGCQAPPEQEASKPVAASAAVSPDKTGDKDKAGAKEHDNHEGCSDDHGKAGTDDTVRKGKDPKSGADMLLVGSDLAGLDAVSVKDLLAKPDDYAGKTVRIEGDVNAMCHHRRGWFSVQDEGDRTGDFVRVLTNPKFLVPAGSIGKKVRAEGTVDVIEESAAAAKHYAEGHKIGDPGKIEGPVKRVVIRASGAEFI